MGKIKKIYICNHSHTDIGFTDYQDACFRQHGEFVEQALDPNATRNKPSGTPTRAK